jgi:GGDEF domain-containing protein
MRSGRSRLTLLQTFSVLSLVVIAAIGVTLGTILHARIERRAVDDTRRLAVTVARVGIEGQLRAGEPNAGPLWQERIADLDRWFKTSGLLRGKLYDRDGHIKWSDDHSFIGQDASAHRDVREALGGETEAGVEESEEELGAKGRFIEIYVPIRGGAFESYMSYEPTAKAIASDTRILIVALGAGLLLLWLVLFRVVARASRRLRHQANHDRLTDLPNRVALHQEAERKLAGAQRLGCLAALLLIDLDRFKEVNDTLGHEQGDHLLIEVAHRLREVLRRSDLLARLGGDEFAVLATLPYRGALGEVAPVSTPRSRARSSLPAASRSSSAPRSASRCSPTTATTSRRSCVAPTWRCTRPSAPARASRPTTPTAIPTRPSACSCSASCATGSTTTSSCCTSSPRSRWRRSASSASRRSCAGSTPSAGCSVPATSSGSRSGPA